MPYIEVRIASGQVSDNIAKQISTGITDVMSNVLNKKRELVAVTVSAIAPERWFIADQSLKDSGHRTTAFVSARITQGTNTEEQKALAQEQIYLHLVNALGPLHEASYIVLKELPATDWGYSGRSQRSRQVPVKRLSDGSLDTGHYEEKARRLRAGEMRRGINVGLERLVSLYRKLVGTLAGRDDGLLYKGASH